MLVSFNQTFLISHVWNPSCFHFLVVNLFHLLFLFCVFMFPVSAFRFWCWLCFGVFYFVLGPFYFVIVLFFVSYFACTDYEKHGFPCNASVFSHVGYKVGLYFVQFHVLVLVCFFLVLFVSILVIWLYFFVSVLSVYLFL